MKLFVLNPKDSENILDSNENSIALKLAYKNSSIFFGGDIVDKTMARLEAYGEFLKSDILKVPHHGGGLGEDRVVRQFFEAVSPKIAVISAGSKWSRSWCG